MRLWVLLLLSWGCRYTSSPYTASLPDLELNRSALREIQQTEAASANTYYVAILADTHNYYRNFEAAVDKVNELNKYAFVIIAGDLTNMGFESEFRQAQKIVSKLKAPVLVVAGNHDMISNGPRLFERFYGPDRISFSFKDAHFIIFNNNNWEIGDEVTELAWLEAELTQAVAPFKILISHIPLDDGERFTAAEKSQYRTLVSSNNVDYVLNGHNHNHGRATFGGARKITIGSVSKKSFVELRVSPGGVTDTQVDF